MKYFSFLLAHHKNRSYKKKKKEGASIIIFEIKLLTLKTPPPSFSSAGLSALFVTNTLSSVQCLTGNTQQHV